MKGKWVRGKKDMAMEAGLFSDCLLFDSCSIDGSAAPILFGNLTWIAPLLLPSNLWDF